MVRVFRVALMLEQIHLGDATWMTDTGYAVMVTGPSGETFLDYSCLAEVEAFVHRVAERSAERGDDE